MLFSNGGVATSIPSIVATQNGLSTIDLSWTNVSADTYEVERSTNGGATWSSLVTQAGTTYSDTTVSFPGSYSYRVRSVKNSIASDWSTLVTETMVDVPAAPGGLTVTGATTSSISLSWSDTAGEESYQIESSVDGLGSWTSAGSTNQNVTTFTHSGLAESVQRYYRVTAFNKAGGGLASSTANSWTVPSAPTGLTATATSSTQIDLAWTDVSTGNQSYKVERSTDNTNWTEIATGLSATATSYSATGLTDGTLYYFRVRAANAARNSDYSGTASATTSVAAPSSLTATATSSTQIDLAWTDNSSTETGFKVERSTDNTNWTEIAGALAANTTSYSATGLTASTLYYFRVRAYNAGGNSAYTSSASATTQSGSSTYTIEYLTVGGGGAGGSYGGGGAGGYKTASGFSLTVGTSYSITVGAGGAAGTTGGTGNNSVFSTVTATGGGGGGAANGNGTTGGSGGGGGVNFGSGGNGGSGTSGEGNAGGNGQAADPYSGGGGGGADAAGAVGTTSGGGNGGAGKTFYGSDYGGGGGGGSWRTTTLGGGTGGTGGTGGGGNGQGKNTPPSTSAGGANTGGGGGGFGNGGQNGAAGGSGVVILRVPAANYSGTTTGSPTVTDDGSTKVLKFTASGSYTG